MIWQIVCRIDKDDLYEPISAKSNKKVIYIDAPGDENTIQSNVKPVLQRIGVNPSTVALDLLHLAMTVYSADKRVSRRRFAYNRWERGFKVFLPVSNPSLWESVRFDVEKMLGFLTSDHWKFEFRQAEAEISIKERQDKLPGLSSPCHAIALLSGGLDSFAGAIDCLEENSTSVVFVSHYGSGSVTHKVQDRVYSLLTECYPKRFEPLQFFVQPPRGQAENSSRSRSVLFLSLGVAVASALNERTPLRISENGFMSLNVPLAQDRIGSLSTRTTHPYFLGMFRQVLCGLEIEVPIENPYRFLTKGEMLENLKNLKAMQRGVELTMSCSNSVKHRFQGISPYTHCGYCLPCLVRRAATCKAGMSDVIYNVDILKNPYGQDLRALKMAIRRMEILEGPLIFDVLKAGPLSDFQEQYVDVYRRGMLELKQFLYQSYAGQ